MEYYKNLELENISYIDDDGFSKIEQWKDIPGYEKLYQASDLGRIKGITKLVDSGNGFYRIPDRILKQSDGPKGYLTLSISKDKKSIKHRVNVLIGMAFLKHDPKDKNKIIDHIFQNRKDNRLCVLQILSQRENTNKKHLKSSSEYVGVYFHNTHKKWCSAIRIKNNKIHLGVFDSEIDASQAYQKALENWEEYGIEPEAKKFGSQYKGVTFFKARNKWVAKIKINGKLTHIGIFKTELEAHYAFQEALKNNPGSCA